MDGYLLALIRIRLAEQPDYGLQMDWGPLSRAAACNRINTAKIVFEDVPLPFRSQGVIVASAKPKHALPFGLNPSNPLVQCMCQLVEAELYTAVQAGRVDMVHGLLEMGVNAHTLMRGWPLIVVAARAGHADVMEVLLEHGADLECRWQDKAFTPRQGLYAVILLSFARKCGESDGDPNRLA
jgi:hypothetical protein